MCGKDDLQPCEARRGEGATQALPARVSRGPESLLQSPHHLLELCVPEQTNVDSVIPSISLCKFRGLDA